MIPFSEGAFSPTYTAMRNMLLRYRKRSPACAEALLKLRRGLYRNGM